MRRSHRGSRRRLRECIAALLGREGAVAASFNGCSAFEIGDDASSSSLPTPPLVVATQYPMTLPHGYVATPFNHAVVRVTKVALSVYRSRDRAFYCHVEWTNVVNMKRHVSCEAPGVVSLAIIHQTGIVVLDFSNTSLEQSLLVAMSALLCPMPSPYARHGSPEQMSGDPHSATNEAQGATRSGYHVEPARADWDPLVFRDRRVPNMGARHSAGTTTSRSPARHAPSGALHSAHPSCHGLRQDVRAPADARLDVDTRSHSRPTAGGLGTGSYDERDTRPACTAGSSESMRIRRREEDMRRQIYHDSLSSRHPSPRLYSLAGSSLGSQERRELMKTAEATTAPPQRRHTHDERYAATGVETHGETSDTGNGHGMAADLSCGRSLDPVPRAESWPEGWKRDFAAVELDRIHDARQATSSPRMRGEYQNGGYTASPRTAPHVEGDAAGHSRSPWPQQSHRPLQNPEGERLTPYGGLYSMGGLGSHMRSSPLRESTPLAQPGADRNNITAEMHHLLRQLEIEENAANRAFEEQQERLRNVAREKAAQLAMIKAVAPAVATPRGPSAPAVEAHTATVQVTTAPPVLETTAVAAPSPSVPATTQTAATSSPKMDAVAPLRALPRAAEEVTGPRAAPAPSPVPSPDRKSTVSIATPSAVDATAVPEVTAKPPPSIWQARTDAASGRTYYYNPQTRKTQWKLPEEAKAGIAKVAPATKAKAEERATVSPAAPAVAVAARVSQPTPAASTPGENSSTTCNETNAPQEEPKGKAVPPAPAVPPPAKAPPPQLAPPTMTAAPSPPASVAPDDTPSSKAPPLPPPAKKLPPPQLPQSPPQTVESSPVVASLQQGDGKQIEVDPLLEEERNKAENALRRMQVEQKAIEDHKQLRVGGLSLAEALERERAELQRQSAEEAANPKHAEETSTAQGPAAVAPSATAGNSVPVAAKVGGSIFGCWKELFHKATGRHYYRHIETNEAVWKIPEEVKKMKEELQSKADRIAGNSSAPAPVAASPTAQSSQAPTAAVSGTAPTKKAGSNQLRALGPWKELRDPASGRLYYTNSETKARTWKIAETPFAALPS